jgi:hypothetical protein
MGRDKRPNSSLREPFFEVAPRLTAKPVIEIKSAGDVRAEDAVLDRKIAKTQRLENNMRIHLRALSGIMRSSPGFDESGTPPSALPCLEHTASETGVGLGPASAQRISS